jgi:hypothetical protein
MGRDLDRQTLESSNGFHDLKYSCHYFGSGLISEMKTTLNQKSLSDGTGFL